MAWTPPKSDNRNVGAFVAENYGKKSAAFQQRLYRKLLGKGYEYYRQNDSSPYARVTDPMKREKPSGWGTGSNIIGGWDKKPNLDASQYQIGQNAVGRHFARPHDIKNYLDGGQLGLIRSFEEKASAANAPVEAAYGDYQQAAQATANQVAAQNKAAQELIGKTYSGPEGGQSQQAAQDDAAAYGAAALPAVNSWAAMPTIAAQNKANALASVKQQVDDARREMMMQMYAQVQEERIAKARNAAEIRMAQMQNLAETQKLAQQGDQFDRNLANELLMSREGNANDLAKAQLAAGASDSGGTGATAKDYRKWRGDLTKRMKGTYTSGSETHYMIPDGSGYHDKDGTERGGWVYVDGAGYMRYVSDGTIVRSTGLRINPKNGKEVGGPYAKMPDKTVVKKWNTQKAPVSDLQEGSRTGWGELFVEGIAEGFTPKQIASALYVANPSLRKLPKGRFANALFQRLKTVYGNEQAGAYVRAVVPGWKG